MALVKALLYLALLIGAFVLAGIVISAVLTALSLLWFLLTTGLTIAVFAALVYGGYKLYTAVSGSSGKTGEYDFSSEYNNPGEYGTDSALDDTTTSDPVERHKEKYANGRISEAELERRLEEELDTQADEIDRELASDRR